MALATALRRRDQTIMREHPEQRWDSEPGQSTLGAPPATAARFDESAFDEPSPTRMPGRGHGYQSATSPQTPPSNKVSPARGSLSRFAQGGADSTYSSPVHAYASPASGAGRAHGPSPGLDFLQEETEGRSGADSGGGGAGERSGEESVRSLMAALEA